MTEEKTEVKEDPRKKDIIKVYIRVRRTSVFWRKDKSTIPIMAQFNMCVPMGFLLL